MARLNARPSTLSEATSRYQSATPQPDFDQENVDPENPNSRAKSVRPSMQRNTPSRTATPQTAARRPQGRGAKRSRAEETPVAEEEQDAATQEEEKFTKYFDPYQEPSKRRDVRKRGRELGRTLHDKRDEFMKDAGHGLIDTLISADKLYHEVKQTGDATLDSKLLTDATDMAYKKSKEIALGNNNTGVDIEEFLSKLVSYMRNHGAVVGESTQPAPTQRRRAAVQNDDDSEDEVEVAPLDWDFLGRTACYQHNSRPPVRTFLLGPLSLEKKQRSQTQRRGRNARDANVREARPEAITREDLVQNESASLTAQCTAIRTQLKRHIKSGSKAMLNAGITEETITGEEGCRMMHDLRLCNAGDQLGVSLMEWVVNPKSFSQTVENLFYVSFLLKEGSAGIAYDEDDLPVLFPSVPRSVEEHRAKKLSKQQTIMSMEMSEWRDIISAFEITESMIPHRADDQQQVSGRGWYG